VGNVTCGSVGEELSFVGESEEGDGNPEFKPDEELDAGAEEDGVIRGGES
jgi:hypothetical protein